MARSPLVTLFFALLAAMWPPEPATAEEAPSGAESADWGSYLFGDAGGMRPALAEMGVKPDLIITTDTLGNTTGGLKQGATFSANVDLTFEIDTEKLGLWNGGQFFVYFLGDVGEGPSRRLVGDRQVVSNIDAPETAKLYEAWYEQTLMEDSVSVLAGLYDYNSEFQVLDTASNLLNSSFGVTADLAQTGPSIFPTTSLAARLRVALGEEAYALGAVFDGVPGDPNNPRGTHVDLHSDDGFFWAGELGTVAQADKPYYKAAAGAWYHSADSTTFDGKTREGNWGAYGIGETVLLPKHDDCAELSTFLQASFVQLDTNEIGQYFGAGIRAAGIIGSRPDDALSLGVAVARLSEDYRDVSPDTTAAETAIELNYRVAVTPYFALTPDIQFVINPGATQSLDDSLVVGMRTELSL